MSLYDMMREDVVEVYLDEGWNYDLHRDSTIASESMYSSAEDWNERTPSTSPLRDTIDGKN